VLFALPPPGVSTAPIALPIFSAAPLPRPLISPVEFLPPLWRLSLLRRLGQLLPVGVFAVLVPQRFISGLLPRLGADSLPLLISFAHFALQQVSMLLHLQRRRLLHLQVFALTLGVGPVLLHGVFALQLSGALLDAQLPTGFSLILLAPVSLIFLARYFPIPAFPALTFAIPAVPLPSPT
jgi:hypothetical protein